MTATDTRTQNGVDLELLSNLCGRFVKPNMDRHPAYWPWKDDFAHMVCPAVVDPNDGCSKHRNPDGTLSKFDPKNLDHWPTYPGLENDRAEVVAVFRHHGEIMLKVADKKGRIGTVNTEYVLLATETLAP